MVISVTRLITFQGNRRFPAISEARYTVVHCRTRRISAAERKGNRALTVTRRLSCRDFTGSGARENDFRI